MDKLKKYRGAITIWLVFEAIAVLLWLVKNNFFYLFNFTYIGTCIAIGLSLFTMEKKYARHFIQLSVGLYLLGYLGIIEHENMQIEGFWYCLSIGAISGATIHYLVAKLIGPAVFARGFCGYACWTSIVLDLLPWHTSPGRKKKLGIIRYILLFGSIVLIAAMFLLGVANEQSMFVAFLIGNAAYYLIGILIATLLHDNRAFCKYVCPVGILMKPASTISLIRVSCDHDLCVDCGACKKVCPMDVDMLDDSRKRENGSECILCLECVRKCPKKALKL